MAYGMGQGNQPIIVLREGTDRSRNKEAQFNNIAAARAVADSVKSTLGPKGMDKMLVDSMGDVVITNDGVTILKEIDVQHPAAKMVVEIAKTRTPSAGTAPPPPSSSPASCLRRPRRWSSRTSTRPSSPTATRWPPLRRSRSWTPSRVRHPRRHGDAEEGLHDRHDRKASAARASSCPGSP